MSDLSLLVTSRRFRLAWIIPAGLALTIVLGMAAARFGAPIFGAIAGPLLALLIASRPELGVYAISLSLPIEDLIPGIGAATGTRLIGMMVFGIWSVRRIVRRESWLPLLSPPVIIAALAFTAWGFVSILWATYKQTVIVGLISQAQLIALALIVIDLVKSYDKVVWIARLLVLGGLIAAGFTIEQYFVAGNIRAGDGISGGINFTASFLVSILPFAFYMLRSASSRFWTFLGLLYIPAGVLAVTVTFSRTSYIMMVLVLAIHALLLLRSRTGGIWMVLLGGLSAASLIFVPQEAINDRVQSITPLITNWISPSPNAVQQADARAYHWKVGYEMFKGSPIQGVGFNNYGEQFLVYQFEVKGTPEIFANPRSPHSSYIGVMVDLGIVGIAIFVILLGLAFINLIRAVRLLKNEADRDRLFLTQAVLFVFLLQLFYGWALNTHMNKNFWLIVGLSAVLLRLAQKPEGHSIGGHDVR